MFRVSTLSLATAALFFGHAASAESLTARYDVMVGGLLVGKATISGDVSADSYSLSLNASMTGLVGAIAGGKGSATSSGAIAGQRVVSSGYALRASNGSQSRLIQIGMARGNASSVNVTPPFVASPERSPVTAAHKKGVVDPLAALLMPVKGANAFDKANCNRTLPVFDGAQRFDIKMSFSRIAKVKIKGYQGPVLVCSARYVPLGGHFPKRPQTKFMIENKGLSAWLAPVAGGHVLAPVQINVRTAMGETVIAARQFPGDQDNLATASTGQ
jgi:hypothetical protein